MIIFISIIIIIIIFVVIGIAIIIIIAIDTAPDRWHWSNLAKKGTLVRLVKIDQFQTTLTRHDKSWTVCITIQTCNMICCEQDISLDAQLIASSFRQGKLW